VGLNAGGGNDTATYENWAHRYTHSENTWLTRTDMSKDNRWCAGASLTSDLGLMCGGNNGTGSTNDVDRYSESGNSWTSRTAMSNIEYDPAAWKLTDDLVIRACGWKSTYDDTVERYSDTGNSWTARTSSPEARMHTGNFGLTSDLGLMAGGQNTGGNGTYQTRIFSESGNNWISKANIETAAAEVYLMAAFPLDTDHGVVSTGNVYGGFRSANTDKFTLSSNTWSSRQDVSTIRAFAAGFGLTSTTGIISGGYDSVRLDSTEHFTDDTETPIIYGSAWSMRTNIGERRYGFSGFDLTSDKGITAGGINGPSQFLTRTESYSDNENAWSARTGLSIGRDWNTCFGLTTDLGMTAGGGNGSAGPNYFTYADRYSDTGNNWTSRTAITVGRISLGSFPLTSDLGVVAGGWNGGGSAGNQGDTDRYSDSGNSWTSRTELDPIRREPLGGFAISTNEGIVAGGQNDSVFAHTSEYSNSGNSWTNRNGLSLPRRGCAEFALSLGTGLAASGYGPNGVTDTTEKYDSTTTSWTMQLPPIIGKQGAGSFATTENVTGGIIAGGYNPGYGTYTDQTQRYSDVATAEAFTPKYRLRLKFNLPRGIGNVWSISGSVLDGKQRAAGFGVTTNLAIYAGGGNNSTSYSINTERYNSAAKSAISKTNTSVPRSTATGSTLTSDSGIISGGYNGSDRIGNAEKFSDNGNIWTSRTSMSKPRNLIKGFPLTTNSCLTCGGQNLHTTTLGETERYSDSGNSWTTRTNMTSTQHSGATFALTTNTGIYSGGVNSSIHSSNTTQMFTDSSNSWSYRSNNIGPEREDSLGFESKSDTGICCGGANQISTKLTNCEKFSNIGNVWITIPSLVIARGQFVPASLSGNSGLVISGVSSGLTTTIEQYKNGETAFSGFAVQTFS